jgi:allantoinase
VSRRFGIASDRVLVHSSSKPGLVVIEDGSIIDLLDRAATIDGPVVDVGHHVLMPALVDTNVHIGDPGRAHWEAFSTATAAAAAGGVAVLIDMPHTSIPPVVTTSAIAHKHSATAGVIRVDVGFWGGIVPGNLVEARQMADAGVFGFAAFLGPSEFAEFPPIGLDLLEGAMRTANALSRPLLVRADLSTGNPAARTYDEFLVAHPVEAEVEGVAAVIETARRTGAWAHVLGLSAADALPLLAAARADGIMVTVETCPHHLVLSAEEVPADPVGFTTVPPIRDAENRERLWQGLADGVIDMVVSDHAPSPVPRQTGQAVTGIASLELRLPLVWTEARRRGFRENHLAEWMSRAPAALGRITSGRIAPGQRADLVAWDPQAEFTVEPDALHQRRGFTPYRGRRLRGVVSRTWVAGHPVYAEGELIAEPAGRILEQIRPG